MFRPPFFLPLIYSGLRWRMPTRDKILYLTFDDGPIPGPTEFVLDELKKRNAKATFFCCGDNVARHPGIFSRVVAEGHAVGNHTFHHINGWDCNAAEYLEDIRLCELEFLKGGLAAHGEGPKLFRPPYGKIKRSQIRELAGFSIIMWDVLTRDYARRNSPEKCLRGSIRAARPGSIVVFHDSLKAKKNMEYALPRFIDHFLAQGYSFKPISNP